MRTFGALALLLALAYLIWRMQTRRAWIERIPLVLDVALAIQSREAAMGGIASVRANAADDARYERKTSKDGQCFFVLKAANAQVIGKSELYPVAATMEKGIASVKANAASDTVKEAA